MSSDTNQLPPAVLRVVWVWVALATAALAAAVYSWPLGQTPSVGVLVGVVVGIAVLARFTVTVDVGETEESTSVDDAAVAAAVLMLPPLWALAAVLAGQLIIEATTHRRAPVKIAFNLSWATVGVMVAETLSQALAIDEATGVLWVATALLAVAAYPIANAVAMGMVIAAHSHTPVLRRIWEELIGSAPMGLAVAGVGVVAVSIVDIAPEVLPLLAFPAYVGHTRSLRIRRLQDEADEDRDKLVRTIEGASDGIVLLGLDGTVEVCNDALAALTDVPADELRGSDLRPHLALVDSTGAPIDVTKHPDRTYEATVERDGNPRVVAVQVTTVRDGDGDPTGLVMVVRDVTREREIDALREDLVSRVSHELRTPLTTITGFTDTLLARWDALDDEARLRYLETVQRGSRRLSRLVTALRARAGLQGATALPHPEVIDLATLAEESIHDLVHELDTDVAITVQGPGAVHADRHHLRQVLDNLLVNAATYGQAPIRLAVGGDADTVTVSVIDHGDGVPDEFLPQLFEAFAQASTGDRRTARGLGLGLSIVRALTEANGGSITYAHTPGGGATFTVELPAADLEDLSAATQEREAAASPTG